MQNSEQLKLPVLLPVDIVPPLGWRASDRASSAAPAAGASGAAASELAGSSRSTTPSRRSPTTDQGVQTHQDRQSHRYRDRLAPRPPRRPGCSGSVDVLDSGALNFSIQCVCGGLTAGARGNLLNCSISNYNTSRHLWKFACVRKFFMFAFGWWAGN